MGGRRGRERARSSIPAASPPTIQSSSPFCPPTHHPNRLSITHHRRSRTSAATRRAPATAGPCRLTAQRNRLRLPPGQLGRYRALAKIQLSTGPCQSKIGSRPDEPEGRAHWGWDATRSHLTLPRPDCLSRSEPPHPPARSPRLACIYIPPRSSAAARRSRRSPLGYVSTCDTQVRREGSGMPQVGRVSCLAQALARCGPPDRPVSVAPPPPQPPPPEAP